MSLYIIWNVASHLTFNLFSPQTWGNHTPFRMLLMFCCSLRFFFLNFHKIVGLFFLVDWWGSEFHEDCISYFLLLWPNPVTKSQSKNERVFFQQFNYLMYTMHKFLYCYIIDGMGVCVSSTYMYNTSIQNLKLAFGWEMILVLSFSSSMGYNLYCSLP